MNAKIIGWFDRTFYSKTTDRWDDRHLRSVILKYISKDQHVLDIGAGRGRILEMDFKNLATRVEGVDPDERVVENPLLDKGHIGLGDDMPFFENDTFDLVFSDNVLEHVEHPEKLFSEVSRVTKPGGFFINKTPNRWHYMPLIASITPTSFHKFVNKLRGRESSDTFPTYYRANSRKSQRTYATASGFKVKEFIMLENRPEYMRMIFVTYPFGIIYERLVNWFSLNFAKSVLISVFVKED